MKKYDIFTFFNELELLEIRLNILYNHVDFFVIIESTETFSGKPKNLFFKENKHLFKKFEDKIIHYVIKDTPRDREDLEKRLRNKNINPLDKEIINYTLTSDNIPEGQIHWFKEFYQKESIKKALTTLDDNDVCFISDVDEIWNPVVKINYEKNDIFKLKQLVYSYYLNNRSDEPWAGTLVTEYGNIRKNCLNHLRTAKKTKYTFIENGGWHFTNQGGVERIKTKLESYGHQEFNNTVIKSRLKKRMEKNEDFVGRKFNFWIDESDLPEYILNNKFKYKNFFKNKEGAEKIIIKLHGGLGNQLFQYALGRNLEISREKNVEFDNSWFDKNKKRKNRLKNLKTKIEYAKKREVKKLQRYKRKEGRKNILHNLLFADESIYIKEKQFNFNQKILKTEPPAYLDGYWQSEKYFEDIKEILKKEVKPKNELSKKSLILNDLILKNNSISMHIRRTDYADQKKHIYFSCPIEYYSEAIKLIKNKINNTTIFVFSDDINWVKNNFKMEEKVFFVNNIDYEDLYLMSLCKHNIIANSTFSWWAAWLNNNKQKIVIYPKEWFIDKNININDLIPETWIKL